MMTDELIEASARLLNPDAWEMSAQDYQDAYGRWYGDANALLQSARRLARSQARAVLNAAAPLIAAKALRDAADEVRNYAYQPDDVSGPFPADQQPAYLAGATDAHHVVDRLLKARAAELESGARP